MIYQYKKSLVRKNRSGFNRTILYVLDFTESGSKFKYSSTAVGETNWVYEKVRLVKYPGFTGVRYFAERVVVVIFYRCNTANTHLHIRA